MSLPFTVEQFFDVFAAYNESLWPFVVTLWLTTALAAFLLGVHADLTLLAAGIGLLVYVIIKWLPTAWTDHDCM